MLGSKLSYFLGGCLGIRADLVFVWVGLIFEWGIKFDLVLCRNRNWLGFVCGAKMTCFLCADRLTWFLWGWSKLTWCWCADRRCLGSSMGIDAPTQKPSYVRSLTLKQGLFVCGPKMTQFCMGIEIDLVFVYVVETDLMPYVPGMYLICDGL